MKRLKWTKTFMDTASYKIRIFSGYEYGYPYTDAIYCVWR